MCLDLCRSEYAKVRYLCDIGMTMVSSVRDVCISGKYKRRGFHSKQERELLDKRLICFQNCKQGCLKATCDSVKSSLAAEKTGHSFPIPLTGKSMTPASKLFLYQSTSLQTRFIMKQRNLQSRGRTSWLLARNVRVHFHRHHGEVFPEGRQMEEEIQKEEEDSTDF
ncbi:hypothetical protein AVEN_190484-1 [Araneus ventricosus]|uniref:Uncharacterized protein n=1 Tax=Araneus ventricosus TaxID=182803 RepID=A0A4Y2JG00_ARAVE|nr:hypothetical protein AVEN_190484-1 [Araneus ventricosus]